MIDLLHSVTLLGVETKEGLSKLMMDMGVDHLNLACSDNAVLLELAVRLRHEREKNKANMTERAEDEDNEKTNLDDLRTILRRRPFKAKLRHPKTMVRDIATVYGMYMDSESMTFEPDFRSQMFANNTRDQ